MPRTFCQKTFHEFEAERKSFSHQVWIVVRRKSVSATRQGIAEFVHCNFLDGTSAPARGQGQKQQDRAGAGANPRIHRWPSPCAKFTGTHVHIAFVNCCLACSTAAER